MLQKYEICNTLSYFKVIYYPEMSNLIAIIENLLC